MYKNNFIFFAFSISILIHILVFYGLNIENDKSIKEVVVLDLGAFQESYQPIEKKKIVEKNKPELTPPKKQKKIIKPEIKKELKEELVKEETIPIQKLKDIQFPEKKIKKKNEITEKSSNKFPDNQKEIKTSTPQQIAKKKQAPLNKKILVNKEMTNFLNLISKEINILAHKSYPKQSIRKGEQGTIISIITLNGKGDLLKLEFANKRPLRLHKATEKILLKYNFPKPPNILLDNNLKLKIKIPVNFILR